MNILNIAIKEIRSSFRDFRTFVFMLAFPIVLILILGTALTNAFAGSVQVGDIRLLYANQATDAALTEYWNGFAKAVKSQGVELIPAEAGTDGREAVRDDQYTAYAEVGDNGIAFYGSSKNTIESNILQGMLTVFADRYNLAAAALKQDPAAAQAIIAGAQADGDFVKETSVDPDRKPGSIDYYAMVMTTMFALYAAIPGSMLFRGEEARNTWIRLSASPVSKGEIFAGKIIGATFMNSLCIIAVLLFSKLAFHADWGSHYGVLVLVLVTEVLLAVSIGMGLGFLFKGDAGRSVVTIFIQIASFAGGAYFPIGDADGSFVDVLLNLNPLRWANTALTQIIYSDDLRAALPAIGLNVGVAAAFLILAVILMRRREAA